MKIPKLRLDQIRMDGDTQPRAALDFEAIDDYAEAMQAGIMFPPVVVFHDGHNYWLADGFHRAKAAAKAGLQQLDCDIRRGSQADAQWFSFGANATNGLRRTNEDKQRAVKAALLHPRGAGLSDSQVAEHVGVDHKTVAAWREKLESTREIPKSPKRMGRDGRTINTSMIGKGEGRKRRTAPTGKVQQGDLRPEETNSPDSPHEGTDREELEAREGSTVREAILEMPRDCDQRLQQLLAADRFLEPSLRDLWEKFTRAHSDLVAGWNRASEVGRKKLSARSDVKKFVPSQPWRAPEAPIDFPNGVLGIICASSSLVRLKTSTHELAASICGEPDRDAILKKVNKAKAFLSKLAEESSRIVSAESSLKSAQQPEQSG